MKHIVVALMVVCSTIYASAQDQSATVKLPNVKVKTLKGEAVQTSEWSQDSLLVICFWATWCKPCIQELQTYAELYEGWQEKTGARIIAVSIDDSRNARKVPSFVMGRNWPFDVVLDENADFKRAMNVNNVPHTFLLKNGSVVWQHSAFAPGDEITLEEQLQKFKAQSTSN